MLADDEHAVLVLGQAGWHVAKALQVPSNVTLLHLPDYSPQFNPIERLWSHLRSRYLGNRVYADYEAMAGNSDGSIPGQNKLWTPFRFSEQASANVRGSPICFEFAFMQTAAKNGKSRVWVFPRLIGHCGFSLPIFQPIF